MAPHHAEINAIRAEFDRLGAEYGPQLNALTAEFAPRLTALNEQYAPEVERLNSRLRERQQAMQEAIREDAEDIDPDDYPIPETDEADEAEDDALYDSVRDYDEQLAAYKAFQGRGDDDGE